ncbi:MAG: ATP-binding protein [Thermoprotei archaeon]|jgi:uncharacterized protein (TIGR00269 family)
MLSCKKCGKPAVYLDKRSGTALCEEHFRKSLEERVRKQVRSEGLGKGNRKLRIVMGISGGKDSLVMMDLLWMVEKQYDVELVALTIDEGIEGGNYRKKRFDIIERMTKERGIKWELKSFKQKYGFSLDEAVSVLKGKEEPCSICGVLRRRALNDYAMELKADYLAIAHNLDDEAETVLMNVIRGDVKALRRSEEYVEELMNFYVPRLKPMKRITERETAFYAYLLGIPPEDEECPYARSSLRDKVRTFLETFEMDHPAVCDSLVRVGDELKEKRGKGIDRSYCAGCGYPTSAGRTYCRVCEIGFEVKSGLMIVDGKV